MRRGWLGLGLLAVVVLAVAAAAQAGGSFDLDHALQRPAPADGRRARLRVREADRHQRLRPLRRRGRARRADRAGGLALACRRLLHRELAAARGARRSAGSSRTVAASTLAKTSAKYSSPQKHWVGVSARVSALVYNTDEPQAVAAAALGARPRRPEVEGQARARPDRDRLPADRHRGRRALRQGARDHVARGRSSPTRAATSTPTTRRSSPRSTAGQGELGVINHYYWYRLRRRARRVEGALRRALLRAGRPRLRDRRLGRRHPRVELAPGRGSEVPRVPRQPAGAGDPRPRRELRVPARLGRRQRAKPLVPFATLRPDPITVAQLGDGSGGDRAAARSRACSRRRRDRRRDAPVASRALTRRAAAAARRSVAAAARRRRRRPAAARVPRPRRRRRSAGARSRRSSSGT